MIAKLKRPLLFLLFAAILHPAFAQVPYLVKDIYPGSGASPKAPSDLLALGNTLYFVAYGGVNLGVELWKSDGTAAGTVVVKDIRPGPGNSNPKLIGGVNGNLLFEAEDGVTTRGLWRTDGTAAGTVKIKVLQKLSGPLRGPWALRDITLPWAAQSRDEYGYVRTIGSTLYFSAYDLWKSDGTTSGTEAFYFSGDPFAYATGDPIYLTNFKGDLFFYSRKQLGQYSDSKITIGGPTPSASDEAAGSITVINGVMYNRYASSFGMAGLELFKNDGSGWKLVKDIDPRVWFVGMNTVYASSDPKNLTNVNGVLYFSADNGTNGQELWKSDGSSTGTVLVKDANPGTTSSDPQSLTNLNGTLFYVPTVGPDSFELWKSNGTSSGTTLFKDIYPGSSGSSPQHLKVVNGTLYFTANNGTNGIELWQSDGTVAGTKLVKDIHAGNANNSSDPQNITNVYGNVFFTADDGIHGRELWFLKTQDTAPAIGSISNANIPDDRAYTGPKPTLTQGTVPLTWALVQKPTGMTLNTSTGVVTWPKPIVTGSPTTVTLKATNSLGQATMSWKLTVGKLPVIGSISGAHIPDDRVYTGPTPVLTRGTAPVTWTLTQSPTGMTINPSTGVVTWSRPAVTGSPFTVTLKATNSFGQSTVSWKLAVFKRAGSVMWPLYK